MYDDDRPGEFGERRSFSCWEDYIIDFSELRHIRSSDSMIKEKKPALDYRRD